MIQSSVHLSQELDTCELPQTAWSVFYILHSTSAFTSPLISPMVTVPTSCHRTTIPLETYPGCSCYLSVIPCSLSVCLAWSVAFILNYIKIILQLNSTHFFSTCNFHPPILASVQLSSQVESTSLLQPWMPYYFSYLIPSHLYLLDEPLHLTSINNISSRP